ncbi:MAG TPA: hypothetical protein VFF73_33335 [Planctomycetota bacterium]|nr:hypothetical protein [Planctomycetota bacterium]
MIEVHHLIAGATGSLRLVHDDADRHVLLRLIACRFGPTLLAYCVMDTHVHLTLEGDLEQLREALRLALRAYARTFNLRHGEARGPLLRGPVEVFTKRDPFELARLIRYVHRNPLDTHPPVVEDPIAFEWSSARAYVGLTLARVANVERARALLGGDLRRLHLERPPLANLVPVGLPRVSLANVAVAAAQAHGIPATDLASAQRSSALNVPRGTFVALGRLEAYRDPQLARALGRTPQRVWQLAAHADETAVRIARTLLVSPTLRRRLGSLMLRAEMLPA